MTELQVTTRRYEQKAYGRRAKATKVAIIHEIFDYATGRYALVVNVGKTIDFLDVRVFADRDSWTKAATEAYTKLNTDDFTVVGETVLTVKNPSEMRELISPRIFSSFGLSAMQTLFPGEDLSKWNIKSPPKDRAIDTTVFDGEPAAPDPETERLRKEAGASIAQRRKDAVYANNPNWGLI